MSNSISNQNAIANIGAEMGRRRMSQRKFAGLMGVSTATMSDRMNGKSPWPLEELDRAAEIFGIPVTLLLQGASPFQRGGVSVTAAPVTHQLLTDLRVTDEWELAA